MGVKKFLKKGGGEILGFAVVLPMIVFCVIMITSIVQLSVIQEHLEYTVYSASRAAVVSDDMETAVKRAEEVAKSCFEEAGYDPDDVSVEMKLDNAEQGWCKGNFLTCKVTVYVDLLAPFTDGDRSASIVMMIERPA